MIKEYFKRKRAIKEIKSFLLLVKKEKKKIDKKKKEIEDKKKKDYEVSVKRADAINRGEYNRYCYFQSMGSNNKNNNCRCEEKSIVEDRCIDAFDAPDEPLNSV